GELGNGSVTTMKQPFAPSAMGAFASIAVGRLHSCAMRSDGSVACWGAGGSGQIAGGMLAVWSPKPVLLPAQASAISAGGNHACALVGGVPYCWGDAHNGQLGVGNNTPAFATPQRVGLVGVAQLTTGDDHTCAIQSSTGDVYCWGSNE